MCVVPYVYVPPGAVNTTYTPAYEADFLPARHGRPVRARLPRAVQEAVASRGGAGLRGRRVTVGRAIARESAAGRGAAAAKAWPSPL